MEVETEPTLHLLNEFRYSVFEVATISLPQPALTAAVVAAGSPAAMVVSAAASADAATAAMVASAATSAPAATAAAFGASPLLLLPLLLLPPPIGIIHWLNICRRRR